MFESSCTTRFLENQQGNLLADTKCEKLPIEICGAGCTFQNAEQTCRDEVVTSIVEIPIEVCDLNPQKICRFATKMSPRLTPKKECTLVPKESCTVNFSQATPTKKSILSKWCLDDADEEDSAVSDSNLVETNDLDLPAVADPRMLEFDDTENDLPSLPEKLVVTEAPSPITATDTIIVEEEEQATYNPNDDLTQADTTASSYIQYEYSTYQPQLATDPPPLRTYGVPKNYNIKQDNEANNFQTVANNLAAYDFPQQTEEEKSTQKSQFEIDLSRVNFPSQNILASGVQPPSARIPEQERHQSFTGGLTLHDDLFPPPPPPSGRFSTGSDPRFLRESTDGYDDNIIYINVASPPRDQKYFTIKKNGSPRWL